MHISNHTKPNPYNQKRYENQMFQKLVNFVVKTITGKRPIDLTDIVTTEHTSLEVCYTFAKRLLRSYYSTKEVGSDTTVYPPTEIKSIQIIDRYIDYDNDWFGCRTAYHLRIMVNGWFVVDMLDSMPWRLFTIIRAISEQYGLCEYKPAVTDIDIAFQEYDYDWIVKMCEIGDITIAKYIFSVLYSSNCPNDIEFKSRCIRVLNKRSDFATNDSLGL